MTLVNVKPWLLCAQHEGWAVGAFNANTLEQVQAITAAAEAENAPVIVQISHRALQYVGAGSPTLGLRYMAEIGRIAAQTVSVPVALHLDHAPQSEVEQAIALGFTSVMFDGGDLPFAENIAITRLLVAEAHALGICVEAELGEVPRADLPAAPGEDNPQTDPAEAAHFAAETGIDALAIAIGSVHAVKQKTVTLDLDRLQAIRAQVSVPLVLHGSSGVTDEHIARGIALGLCKVNVATQLNQAFTGAVRGKLAADPGLVDPRRYLELGRSAMCDAVRERIRFFRASGKACAA